MKRTVLLLFVLLVFVGLAYADNAVPDMRPAAPDVRSEVPSDNSDYLPNVIKQYNNEQKNVSEEASQEEEYEEYEEEYEEEVTEDTPQENEKPVNNVKDDSATIEDVLGGEKNPINDATKENIENKTYTPPQEVENTPKQKVKKQKKEKQPKPKYGKYKDADTDPYIQEWEEELKAIEEGKTPKTSADEVQAKNKTYTQDDYEQAYRDMQVPTFSFVHGVDPDQYYDMKDTTWSPYPLLRLNSPLYFKTMTVEPGYYLLTPRKYKDDWYILFKEAGVVKYTIPVFKKDYTPANYYRNNLREVEMSRSGRWQIKFLNAWGKYIRKSKRKPATKCNIELTDLDNNFLLLDLYYGAHKYSTIFRIEKY